MRPFLRLNYLFFYSCRSCFQQRYILHGDQSLLEAAPTDLVNMLKFAQFPD